MSILSDLNKAWSIFRKDVSLESTDKFEFFSMIVFSISSVLIFSLVINISSIENESLKANIISASLWIIFVFAGMLSYSSLFGREIKSGGFLTALRSFPVKTQTIFIGKLIFNLVLLFSIEFFLITLYIVFFQLSFKSSILIIITVFFLSTLDYSIVGTLVASLTIYSRSKTLVIPLLMFPLILPSVMISVILVSQTITGELTTLFNSNLILLFLHFVILLMVSMLTIETVIKD
ncbi:MAG: heme exporter protein CcmB [Candidatus Hodarchaeales archaeon]